MAEREPAVVVEPVVACFAQVGNNTGETGGGNCSIAGVGLETAAVGLGTAADGLDYGTVHTAGNVEAVVGMAGNFVDNFPCYTHHYNYGFGLGSEL